MSNILYVNSSPRGSASYSNQVAESVIRGLHEKNPGATLTVRDLAQAPLPHIDDDFVSATRSPDGPRTDRQRGILAISDALIDEVLAADILVIAAPMINFSVSSTLKSWIDYIARAGRTFSYSEAGPRASSPARRGVIIVSASGGIYSGANAALVAGAGACGTSLPSSEITDVEVIRVEGTALGPQAAEASTCAGERAQVK